MPVPPANNSVGASRLIPGPVLILKVGDLPSGREHSLPKPAHSLNYGLPLRLGCATQRQQTSPHLPGHARDRVLQPADLGLNLRRRRPPPHTSFKILAHLVLNCLRYTALFSIGLPARARSGGNTRAQ